MHPDDREPTRLAVEAAIRDHTRYESEHRTIHPDTGEVRWIKSAGKATYSPEGKPIRFDGINYDITDRKRAEEAAKAAARDMVAMLESVTDGFIRFDREWTLGHEVVTTEGGENAIEKLGYHFFGHLDAWDERI